MPFLDEADGLVEELRDVVTSTLARGRARTRSARPPLLQEDLHDDIAEFVYDRLRRRPMVLPVVVEV